MSEVNLHLDKKLFLPCYYPYLRDYSHRWEVYCGSAGSGKSYAIAQKLIVRCCAERIKVLVCRRYATTLRNSCFSLFKEILSKWQIKKYVAIKETDMSISFPNGSQIIMVGLDTEEKLLSLNDISMIWVEEAFEVEKAKVEQLDLRMRGSAPGQQIIMSFNPISKQHWLYDFCENEPPRSFIFIHTTYADNSFLSEEYVASLEEMAKRNPARFRVYGKGEWGIDTEGLVITNWRTETFNPFVLAKDLEHRVGCDLGWIDKTAVIDSLYDRENHIIYVFNEFYKSGCQLSDITKAFADMELRKTKIYVDAAEPRSIQFFKQEGFNTVACAKGKDSVKAGLMFLQDNLIIVHPKCVNFITELENFSYIKSKLTGEWTEDTTHEWSHAIDACRYAYSDIYTSGKLKTFNKDLLSL